MDCGHSLEDFFYGVSTVGERGQLVIPADARKKLNIKPGDKLIVFDHPLNKGLFLCKIDSIRQLASDFLEDLIKFEEQLASKMDNAPTEDDH